MSGRRALVAAATAALLVLLAARLVRTADVPRRLRFLAHYAAEPLPVRRLGGTAADFDRDYFILLEWARRTMPAGTPGIAVYPDREIPGRGVYLTIYHFAPLPTVVQPEQIPPGWLALVYGPRRPAGWRVVGEIPSGALLEPSR